VLSGNYWGSGSSALSPPQGIVCDFGASWERILLFVRPAVTPEVSDTFDGQTPSVGGTDPVVLALSYVSCLEHLLLLVFGVNAIIQGLCR